MANNQIMHARDAVSARLAKCFVTIDGKRYNLMNLINFEASYEMNTAEVPIMGRTASGNKVTGWSGSFSGTLHFNSPLFRDMFMKFKSTGEATYFDIQVENEDPTTTVGIQTVIYRDCLINSGILSKIEADGEYLDEDIEGTFEDVEIPQKFNMLAGMEA